MDWIKSNTLEVKITFYTEQLVMAFFKTSSGRGRPICFFFK